MTARQCPKCDLRFALPTELEWHLREEHRMMGAPLRVVSQRALVRDRRTLVVRAHRM